MQMQISLGRLCVYFTQTLIFFQDNMEEIIYILPDRI